MSSFTFIIYAFFLPFFIDMIWFVFFHPPFLQYFILFSPGLYHFLASLPTLRVSYFIFLSRPWYILLPSFFFFLKGEGLVYFSVSLSFIFVHKISSFYYLRSVYRTSLALIVYSIYFFISVVVFFDLFSSSPSFLYFTQPYFFSLFVPSFSQIYFHPSHFSVSAFPRHHQFNYFSSAFFPLPDVYYHLRFHQFSSSVSVTSVLIIIYVTFASPFS